MRCDDARLALSAQLDGEPTGATGVADHLAGCATCRAWLAGAQRVTRSVRLRAVAVPDLTERILRAAYAEGTLPLASPPGRLTDRLTAALATRLRPLLGLLGVVQLMLAVPELFGINGHDAHAGREVAAFDIALAVGLLVVAWYPEYARVFAPVLLALVVCFASISALDLMQGVVSPSRIAIHALAGLQALTLWLLTRGSERSGPALTGPAR